MGHSFASSLVFTRTNGAAAAVSLKHKPLLSLVASCRLIPGSVHILVFMFCDATPTLIV